MINARARSNPTWAEMRLVAGELTTRRLHAVREMRDIAATLEGKDVARREVVEKAQHMVQIADEIIGLVEQDLSVLRLDERQPLQRPPALVPRRSRANVRRTDGSGPPDPFAEPHSQSLLEPPSQNVDLELAMALFGLAAAATALGMLAGLGATSRLTARDD